MSDRIPGTSSSNPVYHRGWAVYLDGEYEGLPFVYHAEDLGPLSDDDRIGWARSLDHACEEIDARLDQ